MLPCQVRKSCAGADALAPCGKARADDELPMAIVAAVSSGLASVLKVSRKAVAEASGLTRSSTRSAALLAYLEAVG